MRFVQYNNSSAMSDAAFLEKHPECIGLGRYYTEETDTTRVGYFGTKTEIQSHFEERLIPGSDQWEKRTRREGKDTWTDWR